MYSTSQLSASQTPYQNFIKNFEDSLDIIFNQTADINQLSLSRGLPTKIWKDIMKLNPLSVAIPKNYGGRGVSVKECLGVLSAASYQSLPLSLTFGINIALFLEPLAKYGNDSIKPGIYKNFMDKGAMGGLMITEPQYGSDALNMKTSNQLLGEEYHIKGLKHWQGLTGMANYWLIASRNINHKNELARDIDFFVSDESKKDQKIEVLEYYDNAGLYMIPYGRNKIDIKVPANHKLQPHSTGLKMMLDILHRSRMQFPGMAMGFLQRLMDDAIEHCQNRMVGNANLFSMDQVQYQLSRMQSSFTICSAMCAKSTNISGIENDVASSGLQANSMKALITDLMQDSAQTHVQLSGAKGYRISHIGGRGIMDSRPFRIFEGSNEMLYTQISDIVLKEMKKSGINHVASFAAQKDETRMAAEVFKKELDFSIDGPLPQRKSIDLGKILARVVSVNDVLELNNAGFSQQLTDNCIEVIREEISVLNHTMHNHTGTKALEDYKDKSNWMDFA
ncbi:acyl-CoA dehydrogenase [Sinomicrobium pectinilyticum]|uniref:Acyl-CoA dehydrogenase n=1 Tax=Sinomicrobium pectinilyticum TaxID=1084421 RepID=A0A3N0EGX5_SINP1|nr:acyl-CoA dehydrogenase family protein [Sinomicrobium pectinilyticum]RNL87128.1 acyl-CoA dehydrogenase [Sinomicrobium pectinilyticum]